MSYPPGTVRRLWPFPHNWERPVDVTISYNTEVFTSRNGAEQRRALRADARTHLSLEHLARGDEARRLRGILSVHQDKPFYLPDPRIKTALLSAASIGATTLTCVRSLPAHIGPGSRLLVGDSEICEVATVSGAVVTLLDPLVAAYPQGTAVSLAHYANIDGQPSQSSLTDTVARVSINFLVEPGSETSPQGEACVDISLGYEVLALRPNRISAPSETLIWDPEVIDFGLGVRDLSPITAYGTIDRRLEFLFRSRAAAFEFESFFHRQKGQRGEFFAPSWQSDLVVASPIAEGATSVTFSGLDAEDFYAGHSVFRHIVIFTHDGRRIYREIVSWATAGGNSVATVDQAFLTNVSLSEIRSVSWCSLSRFAADELTFEWLSDQVCRVAVPIRDLRFAASELSTLAYDGAQQWVFESSGDWIDIFEKFNRTVNYDHGVGG